MDEDDYKVYRSGNQIYLDCKRCEQARGNRCRCKQCAGRCHGLSRENNHPLEIILSSSAIQNLMGIER